MMYFSINRAWLFSRTAQRVYLFCAILDLGLLGTQIGIQAAMEVSGMFALPPMTRILLQLLLIPEVIGTAILTVGMSYCWLAIGGSCGRKLVWILYLPWFIVTMPIYYFAVYRRFTAELNSRMPSVALATVDVH